MNYRMVFSMIGRLLLLEAGLLLLPAALPLWDVLTTVVRRLCRRAPLFAPDSGHLHHRLLRYGFSHRGAAGLLTALSLLCTALFVQLAL